MWLILLELGSLLNINSSAVPSCIVPVTVKHIKCMQPEMYATVKYLTLCRVEELWDNFPEFLRIKLLRVLERQLNYAF